MTHQDYFKNHRISIEQYGVFLTHLAFRGMNTQHGNKGFDVENATIKEESGCRIEVKSKVKVSLGGDKARVIHCNDNKFAADGMTHLVVVLVIGDSYEVAEAWLITKQQTEKLRNGRKYFYVNELRNFSRKENSIEKLLNKMATQSIIK